MIDIHTNYLADGAASDQLFGPYDPRYEGIVVDDICPAKGTVTEKQKAKRGKKVFKLLERIDAEAEKRRFK